MSNTTFIKGFMSFPTKMADGTVIGNEDGGPAFLNSETVAETTPTTGALAGVKVITKHTTAQPTRDIEIGEGERALVPLVTAWALTDMRDKVLVPGPIDHREGPTLILNGLAKFKGGKDMTFGGNIAVAALSFDEITEIVNLTPHPVNLKREGMDDLTMSRPAPLAPKRSTPMSLLSLWTAFPSTTCPTRAASWTKRPARLSTCPPFRDEYTSSR